MFTSATQLSGMVQNLLHINKGTPQGKTNATTSATAGDQISISLAAQKAQAFLNSEMAGDKDPEMDLAGIDNLKQRGEMMAQMLQMKLDKFQGDFLNQVKAAGISTDQPIDLKKGPDGNLLVAGNHPEKSQIEQLLAGNEDLVKKFEEISKLAGLTTILQSVQTDNSSNPFANIAALYGKQSQGASNVDTSKISSDRFQLSVAESGAAYNWE